MTIARLPGSEKARIKQEWADLRATVDRLLLDHENLFLTFRGATERFFSAMSEGRQDFTRRPNISLRLIASGEPLAKLIVLPYSNKRGKTLHCDMIDLELLQERIEQTEHGRGKNWTRRFETGVMPVEGRRRVMDSRHHLKSWSIYRTAVEDAGRVIATIKDFVDDHRAVLARSHDHCCICGRSLTDELSRSRGIGPECIKTTPFLLFRTECSIVEPEPVAPLKAPMPMASVETRPPSTAVQGMLWGGGA
jgi:hypothetical protein